MQLPSDLVHEFVSVCHQMDAKGFVSATDGNVSVRISDDRILFTPSAMNKGLLTAHDLVLCDADGRRIEGSREPSTESAMHLLFYRKRSDIKAVVHAHPVHATAFATAGMDLIACVFPEVIISLGSVPLARYATPSTDALPASLLPFVETHDAILLANHGVVTAGTSLMEAWHRMEKVEHAAHILFCARMLGGEQQLDSEQVSALHRIAEDSYGIVSERKPACQAHASSENVGTSDSSTNDLSSLVADIIREFSFPRG